MDATHTPHIGRPRHAIPYGSQFSRLTVLEVDNALTLKTHHTTYKCLCSCGRTTHATASGLIKGSKRSCGCFSVELHKEIFVTHGRSKTKEHNVWSGIKTRCFNPKRSVFKHYGGRGITMCDRWKDSFENFLADMGPCPPGHTIERKDNNGPYSPENCVWATNTIQGSNRRNNHRITFRGETKTITQWERVMCAKAGSIKRRIYLGWPPEKAITTPFLR